MNAKLIKLFLLFSLLFLASSCEQESIIAGSISWDGTEIYFKKPSPLHVNDPIDIFASGKTPESPIYILIDSVVVDSILTIPFSTTVSFGYSPNETRTLEFRKGNIFRGLYMTVEK